MRRLSSSLIVVCVCKTTKYITLLIKWEKGRKKVINHQWQNWIINVIVYEDAITYKHLSDEKKLYCPRQSRSRETGRVRSDQQSVLEARWSPLISCRYTETTDGSKNGNWNTNVMLIAVPIPKTQWTFEVGWLIRWNQTPISLWRSN